MKIPKIGKDDSSKFVELEAAPEVQIETSPAEIDAKRAAHSLDRAAQLADRGDFAGAILATRQAIALNHDSLEAYGMLGQFLERNGDLKNAAIAYTKALELAPQSVIERASLERVQEKLAESASEEKFSFNEADLGDFSTETTPFDSGLNSESAAAPAKEEGYDFVAPHIEARLPPTRAELEAAAAATAAATVAAEAIVTEPAMAPVAPVPTSQGSTAPVPISAALPPVTSAAVNEEIGAALPPTSAAVVSDAIKGDDVFGDGTEPLDLSSFDFPPVTSGPTASPLAAALTTDSVIPAAKPNRRISTERRKTNVPVQIERRVQTDRRAGALKSVSSPFVFQPVYEQAKVPVWAQFLRQPSFFGRTLPLVILTVFSLGFLTWARDRAVSRTTETPTTIAQNQGQDMVPSDPVTVNPQPATSQATVPQTTNPQTGNPPAGNPANGFTISNNPVRPGQTSGAGATNGNGTSTTTSRVPATQGNRPNGAGRTGGSAPRGSNPLFPSTSLEPAAVPPAAILAARDRARAQARDNNSDLGLPRPQITQDEPADAPVRVLPISPDPSSVAEPLNPAGSTNRGYVRIQSGRLGAGAPQRPQNQANAAEQAAANAARGGQTDQAIQGLTSAINSNASDAGFRFQQRASLFLERGDYGRAADDFQAAISEYQDQINRGENVNSARSGLRSARSGLNLALAARRNGN